MMKKIIILFSVSLIVTLSLSNCIAQSESNNSLKETPWLAKERFYLGGTGGLSFGSVTYVEVAPLVGYKITDRFSIGVNPKYTYIHYKYTNNGQYSTPDYQTHIWGGSFFARYFILDNVFLCGEYELNNYAALISLPNNGGYKEKRITVGSLLLGGGYFQHFGGGSGFYIQVLYDVLQNPYSPYYGVPVIRAGFVFGL